MAGVHARYVASLLWPSGLSIDYPVDPAGAWSDPWAIAGVLLALLAVAGLVIGVRRRNPALALGCGLWVLGLAPVNNVWPSTSVLRADRYLLVPAAGAYLLLAAAMARVPRARVVTLGVLAVVLGFLASHRAESFVDSRTVWTDAIEAQPATVVGRINRAADAAERGIWDRVEPDAVEAIRLATRARRPEWILRARLLRVAALLQVGAREGAAGLPAPRHGARRGSHRGRRGRVARPQPVGEGRPAPGARRGALGRGAGARDPRTPGGGPASRPARASCRRSPRTGVRRRPIRRRSTRGRTSATCSPPRAGRPGSRARRPRCAARPRSGPTTSTRSGSWSRCSSSRDGTRRRRSCSTRRAGASARRAGRLKRLSARLKVQTGGDPASADAGLADLLAEDPDDRDTRAVLYDCAAGWPNGRWPKDARRRTARPSSAPSRPTTACCSWRPATWTRTWAQATRSSRSDARARPANATPAPVRSRRRPGGCGRSRRAPACSTCSARCGRRDRDAAVRAFASLVRVEPPRIDLGFTPLDAEVPWLLPRGGGLGGVVGG